MKRPAFWIVLVVLAIAATIVGIRYFPQAFSIVALDITMDRERALADARALMDRERLGPDGYRQAASFALDDEAQTFVELEGGGKDAFTAMLRDGLYSAYTWRVRQFKEGEVHETLVRFTPDGRPYGFRERLKEDAPGAALTTDDARRIAEESATAKWQVDLRPFSLVERAQERRPGGRVDHTFTYERASPTLREGRYRLRLVVSGDRLTEVTYFVKIPEAFSRRYASMRSANEFIGVISVVGMGCCTSSAESVSACSSCCASDGSSGASRSSGARSSLHAGARVNQRVSAAVDVLRHCHSAWHIHRTAGGDAGRVVRRLRRCSSACRSWPPKR